MNKNRMYRKGFSGTPADSKQIKTFSSPDTLTSFIAIHEEKYLIYKDFYFPKLGLDIIAKDDAALNTF